MLERIFVSYTEISLGAASPFFHKDIIYQRSDGSISVYRGGPGNDWGLHTTARDYPAGSEGAFLALNASLGRETIIEGSDLSGYARDIASEMARIENAGITYNPIDTNSNWAADQALEEAGLDFPTQDDFGEFWSPGSIDQEDAATRGAYDYRGGDSDFCFLAGTIIAVAGNSGRAIEDIKVGDIVLAFDASDCWGRAVLVPARVAHTFVKQDQELLDFHGLKVTPGHVFLAGEGLFERLDSILARNGTVVLEDGTVVRARTNRPVAANDEISLAAVGADVAESRVVPLPGRHTVYNFEVEGLHTYVAGGYRVHNDSQVGIDTAGAIGQALGSQMGMLLGGDNQFAQLAIGTALGTVTRNIGELVADNLFHGNMATYSVVDQLKNVDVDFTNAAVGTASSFLMAEAAEALGIDGFGADLFNTTTSAYLGSVMNQVLTSNGVLASVNFGDALGSMPGAIGAFLGSRLANELYAPQTQAGAIGSSLGSAGGSAFGVWAAGQMAGVAAGTITTLTVSLNFVVPGIGAAVGAILGTFLGDLLGGDAPNPNAWSIIAIPTEVDHYHQQSGGYQQNGRYQIVETHLNDGGNVQATTQVAGSMQDIVNGYLSAVGGELLPDQHAKYKFHYLASGKFEVIKDGETFVQKSTAEEAILDASYDAIKLARPAGGDILIKRAMENAPKDILQFVADMQTAADYKQYLDDMGTINALIAAEPDSAFAAGWTITFARIQELGLTKYGKSDFFGGLDGFVTSLELEKLGADLTDIHLSKSGGEFQISLTVPKWAPVSELYSVYAPGFDDKMVGDERVITFSYPDLLARAGYSAVGDPDGAGWANGGEWRNDLWFGTADEVNKYREPAAGEGGAPAGAEDSNDILIGGNLGDTVQAGRGRDWIEGNAGNDYLDGQSGDDLVRGGAGADVLIGGDGNDLLEGGAGADNLTGGAGVDTVTYAGETSRVVVNLTAGSTGGAAAGDDLNSIERLIGSAFNDAMAGNAGDNVLEGGGGADTLTGGGGFDFVSYAGSFGGVEVTLHLNRSGDSSGADADGDILTNIDGVIGSDFDDVLRGSGASNDLFGGDGDDTLDAGPGSTSGSDRLYGEAGNDTLVGEAGRDNLFGGDGDDILDGRAGSDLMDGGLGNDTYLVDDAKDDVREQGNTGIDRIITSVNYWMPTWAPGLGGVTNEKVLMNVEILEAKSGAGGIDLHGNSFDNTLIGNSGNNSLDGGEGSDVLEGAGGADSIHGGSTGAADFDFVSYSTSANRVVVDLDNRGVGGDAAGDSYVAIEGIIGSKNNDDLAGDAADNVLEGGKGADSLSGAGGLDTASYQQAAAAVIVQLALSASDKGEGSKGDANGDQIDFTVENLTGSGFDDALTGNSQENRIDGGAGNDTLRGGGGQDTLIGGAGNDTYSGSSNVTILEYEGGGTDKVIVAGNYILTNSQIEIVTLASGAQGTLEGNDRSNQLIGNSGNDQLLGNAGDDVLSGGKGSNTLNGGTGSDTASYDDATSAVVIQLAGPNDRDSLISIENVSGSQYDDELVGTAGGNTLAGGAGDDSLRGGAGADQLIGGMGRDTFYVSEASDLVLEAAGQGSDRVWSSSNYALRANISIEALLGLGGDAIDLTGNALDNKITGNNARNTLQGGGGADELEGLAGPDTILGGAGIDTVSYATSAAVVVRLAGGPQQALMGSAAGGDGAGDTIAWDVENVIGSAFADNIFGNELANILIGLAGADQFSGGDGFDFVSYADSTARVVVNLSVAPELDEGTGGDAQGDRIGSDIEGLVGSGFNDRLTGDQMNNTLIGGLGGDILSGSTGRDTVDYSSSGGAVAVFLAVNASASGSGSGGDAAGDTIEYDIESVTGSKFGDRLKGNDLANVLRGERGDDLIEGRDGGDTLFGDEGIDTLSYASSTAGVTVTLTTEKASGGDAEGDSISGFENVLGGTGNDRITGDEVDNRLEGSDGDDVLTGQAGRDELFGDAGADILVGGAGHDELSGGSGADQFRFLSPDSGSGANIDLITDFGSAQGDLIDLREIDANGDVGGDASFTFIARQEFSGARGELRWSNFEKMTLVEADMDGDQITDFVIRIDKVLTLSLGDFLL